MMMNDNAPTGQPASEEARILRSRVVTPQKGEDKNNKQKIEIIALVVLGAIFIYLVATTFFIKPSRNQPAAGLATAPGTVFSHEHKRPALALPLASSANSNVKKEEDEGWGRSPFSLLSEDKKNGGLTLQGIVKSGAESYAVISQKIVKVGDQIDDKKVKEIANGKVILQKANGEEITLKL